jgi:hypothetical protein
MDDTVKKVWEKILEIPKDYPQVPIPFLAVKALLPDMEDIVINNALEQLEQIFRIKVLSRNSYHGASVINTFQLI